MFDTSFFYNETVFFSDFAISAYDKRTHTKHLGILKSPGFTSDFSQASVSGQAFSFVLPEQEAANIALQDELIINSHRYIVLGQTDDGTGLSTLMLERLN